MHFTRPSSISSKFFVERCLLFLACLLLFLLPTATLSAQQLNNLNNLIGNQDSVFVADPDGRIIFSKNADIQLIPASTLKVLTALVALHYLGPDHRFVTEFYLDQNSNLKIKGFGDPVLISENLLEIATALTSLTGTDLREINDLVLDDSYFKNPIKIPGVSSSYDPYNAPNGALSVNFNTVAFKRNKNGAYVSAEPQTPLLPFVLERIDSSSIDQGRVILSGEKNESTLYAGHLFLYFLNKEGMKLNGQIRMGRVQKDADTLIFRYTSRFSLTQVISMLLEHSNNFIANQLLVATGVNAYGMPGTLDKGVRAALFYATNILKIDKIHLSEGSGISKKNRISAEGLYKILDAFSPYYFLMRKTDNTFYKTGALNGIKTRVGYIESINGGLYSFVVLINTPGKSPQRIMDTLLRNLY
jgi:D-alanyl-D-alanine carboxypeptidase/D-alanyl-D-alanine-endopeptidase (penicillin-binding protein 4)